MRNIITCISIIFGLGGVSPIACEVITGDSSLIQIKQVHIKGANHVKRHYIYKIAGITDSMQLPVHELNGRLDEMRRNLMNTLLFASVHMNVEQWDVQDQSCQLTIEILENWYIYPGIYLDLIDRNFNVWWYDYDHDFRRIAYGGALVHSNLSGNGDYFKIRCQTGYVQKLEVRYELPYLSFAGNTGITLNMRLQRNHLFQQSLTNSKEVYAYNADRWLSAQWFTSTGMIWNQGPDSKFQLSAGAGGIHVVQDIVDEGIGDLLPGTANRVTYPFISFEWTRDKRNFRAYPKSGLFTSSRILFKGFAFSKELQQCILSSQIMSYFQSSHTWHHECIMHSNISLTNKDPGLFFSPTISNALDNFLPGYELYKIYAKHYGLLQFNSKWRFFQSNLRFGKWMPIASMREMSLALYLSINSGIGYGYDPYFGAQNPLANTFLAGGGPGIDFVLYGDRVIKLSYSINHRKERGVFIHYNIVL